MTVLPDHYIQWLSTSGGFGPIGEPLITPFSKEQLAPSSYDVRLDSVIRVPNMLETDVVDLSEPIKDTTIPRSIIEGFTLYPREVVLGSTVEWVDIPDDIVGRIEGKSSLARAWIQIHSAGYLDPGFRGNVTLEIVNLGLRPVRLWPNILIAQLCFEYMSSKCEHPYMGRYQDSSGVVGSRYQEEGRAEGGLSGPLNRRLV